MGSESPLDQGNDVPALAIGSTTWPGLAKLAEECGELIQIIGKIIAYPDEAHPDGDGALADGLEAELADVKAACLFVTRHNADRFRLGRMGIRTREKLYRFERWHIEGRDRAALVERDERQADPDAYVEFNPLGGASRGVGRCICAAGAGTHPACQVHP